MPDTRPGPLVRGEALATRADLDRDALELQTNDPPYKQGVAEETSTIAPAGGS